MDKKSMSILILFIMLLYSNGVNSSYIIVDTPAEFNNGVYLNTTYNLTTNTLTYSQQTTYGEYTSEIFDAGTIVNWSNITVVGTPSGKRPVPGEESGYISHNLNGSSAISIVGFDEVGSSSFMDYSAGTNRYSCVLAECPSSTQGVIGNAVSFNDGNDDRITASIGTLNAPFTITVWTYFSHLIQPSGNYDYVLSIASGGDFSNNHISMSRWVGTNEFYSVSHNTVYRSIPLNATEWINLVLISSANTPYLLFYVNGVQQTIQSPSSPVNVGGDVYVGAWGNSLYWHELFGYVDELTIWDRELTPSEIYSIYYRGATKIRFQVRACDDPLCVGEQFVGPDGTNATYFEDKGDINNTKPRTFTLPLNNSRYFQYKIYYSSIKSGLTPEIKNISIGYYAPFNLNLSILNPQNNSITTKNDSLKAYVIDDMNNGNVLIYIDNVLVANITNVSNQTTIKFPFENLSYSVHYAEVILREGILTVKRDVYFAIAENKGEVINEKRGGGTVIINDTKIVEKGYTAGFPPIVEKSADKVEIRTVEYLINKYDGDVEKLKRLLYEKEKEFNDIAKMSFFLIVLLIFLLSTNAWLLIERRKKQKKREEKLT